MQFSFDLFFTITVLKLIKNQDRHIKLLFRFYSLGGGPQTAKEGHTYDSFFLFFFLFFCCLKSGFVSKIGEKIRFFENKKKKYIFFINEPNVIKTSCFHAKRQNTVRKQFFQVFFCTNKNKKSLGSGQFARLDRVTVNKHLIF